MKYRLVFILLCFQGILMAQEVNIEVAGNREIEPAYRLSKHPRLIDSVIPYSEINYPLLALKYETTFSLDTIKAAKTKLVEKLPELLPGYAKIGIGSKFMPLAEVYYNSVRSRKHLYGIHLKHLSSFGNIPNYAPAQFDRTSLNLFGTKNENKYSISGNGHLSSFGLHQYGIKKVNTPKDSIAQRFTDVGADVWFSKHKKDSLNFNYAAGLKYNYYQDKKPTTDSLRSWFAHENYVELNGKGWYKMRKELITADLDLKYNSYKYGKQGDTLSAIDSALTSNDLIFNLKPNITTYAKNNRLKIKFGVNLVMNYHDDKTNKSFKPYIYPDIELKYSMFDDILIPYLEVKGGMTQATFKNLSKQNEFVLSNLSIYNENAPIKGVLGIKGTLSENIMFNAQASFGLIKNKALFVNDTLYARGNQFRVVYEDLQHTSIQGSLIYQSSEKVKVEAIGIFNSYLCKNAIYAWNLPQIQVITRAYYQVMPNLSLSMDVNLEGGRYAQVYTKAESDKEENMQFARKLGFITDINLGANYQYTEKLSAFLQVNNAVAQRYNRWYGYPSMGLQVMGGVAFKF